MNATDHRKLLNQGFTIIRRQVLGNNPASIKRSIKAKSLARPEWFTLENNFPTAASLVRRMDELLKDEKVVED